MTSSHHDLVLQSPPMYRQPSVITSDFDNIWTYETATCDVRYRLVIKTINAIIISAVKDSKKMIFNLTKLNGQLIVYFD